MPERKRNAERAVSDVYVRKRLSRKGSSNHCDAIPRSIHSVSAPAAAGRHVIPCSATDQDSSWLGRMATTLAAFDAIVYGMALMIAVALLRAGVRTLNSLANTAPATEGLR